MRGLDNVKFILSDETDYYPPFQQKEVRAVIEGYIGVVLANIGDNIAYRHGLHFRCQEVYPYRNQKKV